MLKLACLCGQVRVEIQQRPEFINECNCSFCKKAGAWWGYFHPSQVAVEGNSKHYSREDKIDPAAQLHFCTNCDSATHWTLTESAVSRFGNSLMGVNMQLADEADLLGIELRYPDGRAWSGEGDFSYVREARVIGR